MRDRIKESMHIIDVITDTVDKTRSQKIRERQELIKAKKQTAYKALKIVKRWLDDIDDTDPENLVTDIKYILEDL